MSIGDGEPSKYERHVHCNHAWSAPHAHNPHQAFRNCEKEILRLARNPFCPCSNNAAERFHRMSKVKRKMSGTFRSVKIAQACCRVTSCLQTMNLPGYNPLTAIEWVLKGDAVGILEEKL